MSNCVKGWDYVSRERQKKVTRRYQMYVTYSVGGLFLAEVIPTGEKKAERHAVKRSWEDGRRWCEEQSALHEKWWRQGV